MWSAPRRAQARIRNFTASAPDFHVPSAGTFLYSAALEKGGSRVSNRPRRRKGRNDEDPAIPQVQYPRRLPRRPSRQRHVHDGPGGQPYLPAGSDGIRPRPEDVRSGRPGGAGRPGDAEREGAVGGGGVEPRPRHHGHHLPDRPRLAGAGLQDGGRAPAREPYRRHRTDRQGPGAARYEGGDRSGGGDSRSPPAPEVPPDELPILVRPGRHQPRLLLARRHRQRDLPARSDRGRVRRPDHARHRLHRRRPPPPRPTRR